MGLRAEGDGGTGLSCCLTKQTITPRLWLSAVCLSEIWFIFLRWKARESQGKEKTGASDGVSK